MARALRRLTVGEFHFDETTGELSRDGSTTRLRPQAAQVLSLLIESAGQMVSREELQRDVWPAAKVEYDLSLNVCIRQIRVALGDEADSPRYIETLPRRGYRLLANVSISGKRHGERPYTRWAATLALLAAFLVLALWLAFRPMASEPQQAAPQRIAVLPFRSIPPDPAARYLEEGLSEELITALAGLDSERLAVIARTSAFSFAGRDLDPVVAAADLDARYLLEGAIRRLPAGYRVTVRLLDDETSTYVWSEAYDLSTDEILNLERRVAARLSSALAAELGIAPPRLGEPGSHFDPRSRDALLRARYLLTSVDRESARRAVDLLEDAIGADPEYAELFIALARGRLQLGEIDAAEEDVDTARRLAPETPGLEDIAGSIQLYGRLNPWRAIDHLEIEIDRRPGAAAARRTYANALIAAGRADEAVEHGARALELDPVAAGVRGDTGWVYYHARRFDEARRICRSTLELFPASNTARQCVLLAAALSGRLSTEIDLVDDLLGLLGGGVEKTALLAAVKSGREKDLWAWLVADDARAAGIGALNQARVLALLGDHERAAGTLRGLAETAPRSLLFAATDPVFRETRKLEPFRAAIEAAGLGRALEGP